MDNKPVYQVKAAYRPTAVFTTRRQAAYAYRLAVWDALRACSLLDLPIAVRVMKEAERAYTDRDVSIDIQERNITFEVF